ncbi:MAG: hypothetical protein ORN54_02120, partial [Cyclobacteriaceae bacterium]|nr:hypothetical protein [Cyclobacteriaceae bacterium]
LCGFGCRVTLYIPLTKLNPFRTMSNYPVKETTLRYNLSKSSAIYHVSEKHGWQRLCFCSGALPKPRPVPEPKRDTKIKTYSLHVTAPLQKHFVGSSDAMLPLFS